MIFDTVKNLPQYRHLDGMGEVIKFLGENSLNDLPSGRYELPNGIWCTISESKTKQSGDYEVHRKYVDVQVILAGSEKIGWMPLVDNDADYDFSVEKDIGFFDAESERALTLQMLPETFAVFYPEDAHKPLLYFHHACVKKAVFKIPFAGKRE